MRQDKTKIFAIGVEDYVNWGALRGVGMHAENMAGLFGAKSILCAKDGTKSDISRQLEAAISGTPEDGTLVLHWIGHGTQDGDGHYLICPDSPSRGRLTGNNALASGDLGRMLAVSDVRNVVIILDTCFSGAGSDEFLKRYLGSLASVAPTKKGRTSWIFAAAHPLEKAVAGKFSQCLHDALAFPEKHNRWSDSDNPLDPKWIWSVVKGMLGDDDDMHPKMHLTSDALDPSIFPNPRARTIAVETDIETARRLEGLFGTDAHFDLAARGIESMETGYFFSGRADILRMLIEWLIGDAAGVQVVTGPPGSGKSAVVGRLVALSVPTLRERAEKEGSIAPDDLLPPLNIFDAAIHAKGKTVFDCARRLGATVGLEDRVLDGGRINDILRAIETDIRRCFAIDALDEAAEGQAERIVNELINPLSRMPHVKVLVGSRRSLDGSVIPAGEDQHARLRKAFGEQATILDLAEDANSDAAIAEYVSRRLNAAKMRGADEWIKKAKERVAGAAKGSFLYARLVSRSLEEAPDARLDALPASADAAFVEDVQRRFPNDVVRVADMLGAMAWGFGKGLTRKVWPLVASAISGKVYDDDDVVWMLQRVGSYLVEATVDMGGATQAAYRLIHQALGDHLRRGRDTAETHRSIVDALVSGLEGVKWFAVDGYLRRHLAEHAVAANTIDRLLTEPGYMVVAEPEAVQMASLYAASDEARLLAGLYRLAASDFAGLPPIERWALLHHWALCQQQASRVAKNMPPTPAEWTGQWAKTRSVPPALSLEGHSGWVTSVALGMVDSRPVLASGSLDKTVRLWDARTGAAIGGPLKGHSGSVTSVALGTIDGRPVLASGSDDNTVRLWDARTGAVISDPLEGHTNRVNSVALGMFDGRTVLASGSDDNTVRLRDALTGAAIGDPLKGHTDGVNSVALEMVDGRLLLASGSDDRTVRLWDARTGTAIGDPLEGHSGSVISVALGMVDGRLVLASGSNDKTMRLWDARNGTAIGDPLKGHSGSVISVALGMVDGRPVLTSGSTDDTARLWDARTGAAIGGPLEGHTWWVSAVALGMVDGRPVLASGSYDKTMRLWDSLTDAATGGPLEGHTNFVSSVALAMVGRRPVLASGSYDRTVRLWDARTGAAIGDPLEGHTWRVRSVAL